MMNAAFAELGMDWRYVHLPISPALFAETARALPRSGYRGANVTIPHKGAAHDLAGELSAAARAIGAVNTLVFEQDGGIAGHNTDAGGFLDALGGDPAGRRALVLGAGGSARAVAWALREGGADVAVWNRTRDRAAQLADTLGVRLSEQGEPADILVNATSVGLDGEDPVRELPLGDADMVVDLVYAREATPLVRWARARGTRVVDGLEILLAQGARSFELWTSRPPPVAAMRAGLDSV